MAAAISVEFERKHGSGLHFSAVYINDERLPFDNDKAKAQLEPGKQFEVYWRIGGDPGSTFTLKYTAAGVTKTAIDGDKVPSGNTTWSDFTLIKL
jgi:hypothetical protein